MKNSTIRLVKDDLTAMEVESFVFYARTDLKLGAGFGNAIAVRGGPTIQAELDKVGQLEVGDAVVTAAGKLKAQHIIHAVGPKFQEKDLEDKLRRTIRTALERAEEKGIKQVAMPPMGAGFYGVPLDRCADIQTSAVEQYLEGGTQLQEIIFCVQDGREMAPFQNRLAK